MSEKKYVADNPILIAEWHWEKNNELNLNPHFITTGSGKKAWWKCAKGHEWQATVNHRNRGQNCPFCAGGRVIKGENDLATLNPSLAKEWAYEQNMNLTPENFVLGSNKKVWWKCKKGHEWQAVIAHRNKGAGCPYCSGRYAIKGETDLQTINPNLAKEWNFERNEDLKPEQFTAGSNKKVWWKCQKGHEWQAYINNRNKGIGCPICTSERHTSFPEYALLYYLKKYNFNVVHLYKGKGYELDIYLPDKNIAIEYDGYFWHKNKEKKDLAKNLKCKKDGIKLYRIREGLNCLNDTSKDFIIQKDQKGLEEAIKEILSEIIEINADVNIQRDSIDIENLREYTEKETSLLLSNPSLAQEWNYEKNGNLKPNAITMGSNKKLWWVCAKGHEWQAAVSNRNSGAGCPICSGKKVLIGYNDLITINPRLEKEWNYEKNLRVEPKDFTANSGKKAWWKCNKGHEWQATVRHRNCGRNCPFCAGQRVVKGENDLKTVNSKLASEWNYEKNGDATPMDVMPNSGKKVWWKCNKGHEWQAVIASRNGGIGCPICSNKKVLRGYNDLATLNPSLTQEWNYEKNGEVTPMDVTPNSDKKVWWKCNKEHEWKAVIGDRNKGRGCPICSNKKVLRGYNDLATVNLILAKEWNYTLNKELTPFDVLPHSGKKVWWKCSQGHEWQATVDHRSNGRGCPTCSRKKKPTQQSNQQKQD